ncbi:3-hydroxyacyl-ACP dehydratase FabZ [Limosilactobacillus reuteri]|uniref:3-hydroxyacyl-ACP dehydratase FabZ n=1 Tax=Limosilactobacillus reuteri TaxID=1598 RepID=UPI001E57715A|nr:3-hydroxyacyl-ACP dehydratase FabZ [Limosilactobacillus reuteri]MCC4421240.1 3-hydroxyacyl-ACP dehydratase FabZ [Limosilactobacillus reuteri]
MTNKILDITEIQKILPHRYPMLLIDQVDELIPGKKAIARRNVTINEEVFNGHFPKNPVLPGALIVESLAQTGAVALLSQEEFQGKTAYFGGIRSAEFRKVVRPGDTLRLEVNLEKVHKNIGIGKGIATVDGKKACTAELTFMIG